MFEILQNLIFLFIFFIIWFVAAIPLDRDSTTINYPKAIRSGVVFSYFSAKAGHNLSIGDPYNYMEQGVNGSNETKAFVEQENLLTKTYLNSNLDLPLIIKSITNLNNYTNLDLPIPFKIGDDKQYLYRILENGKSKATWYIAEEDEMKVAYQDQFSSYPGKRWFDENMLNLNGTDQVNKMFISPDGLLVAYTLTIGGTSGNGILVRQISSPLLKQSPDYVLGGTGALPDFIATSDGGNVYWTSDSLGFFYTETIELNDDQFGSRIKYHSLGEDYINDIVIADQPKDINAFWVLTMSGDREWIIANMQTSVDFHSAVYVAHLNQPFTSSMKWLSVAPKIEFKMNFWASLEKTFYFATDADDALNIKVVSVEINVSKARSVKDFTDLTDSLPRTTIIPEHSDASFELLDRDDLPLLPSFDNDKIIVWLTRKAQQIINLYDLKSGEKIAEILPEGQGTVEKISCSQFESEYFLSTSTMNKPNTIYRITMDDNDSVKTQTIADQTIEGIDLDSIISEQHFSISKDGTQIPFKIFYKNGTTFDATNPGWLYFYGQYGLIYLPEYRSQFVDFILNYNGTVLWANPRGGGEEGSMWHLGGMREKRQNTVDDVLSVAHYATDNKLVAPGMIIVDGGSAAGVTCMVVTNQAPVGLIGASLCRHGDYDQLRGIEIDASGPANVPEFGDPHNGTDFDWILAYSPLNNVKRNKPYGAILIFTTENDEVVNPCHSFKMIAVLQYENPKNQYPLLLYIASTGGHLAQHSSRNFLIETLSNNLAIITHSLGLERNK